MCHAIDAVIPGSTCTLQTLHADRRRALCSGVDVRHRTTLVEHASGETARTPATPATPASRSALTASAPPAGENASVAALCLSALTGEAIPTLCTIFCGERAFNERD